MTPEQLKDLSKIYDREFKGEPYAHGFIDGFMEAVALMEVKFKDVPPPKDQSDSGS
jgi:hypothetical protein